MRRDHPHVYPLDGPLQLPADPQTVLQALAPMLTERRRTRIDTVLRGRTRSVTAVLDGLIDPHNISAVMRSADAFGIQELHLIEGGEDFLANGRVAQGTERWLDIVRHRDAARCVEQLHQRGFQVYVAQMDGELSPAELGGMDRPAVVFGNEHAGVSEEMRRLADGSYCIPMRGFVESLNVSVAAALTLHAAMDGRDGDLSPAELQALRARFSYLSVPRAAEVVQEFLRRREG